MKRFCAILLAGAAVALASHGSSVAQGAGPGDMRVVLLGTGMTRKTYSGPLMLGEDLMEFVVSEQGVKQSGGQAR